MKKLIITTVITLSLTGCGGSSSSNGAGIEPEPEVKLICFASVEEWRTRHNRAHILQVCPSVNDCSKSARKRGWKMTPVKWHTQHGFNAKSRTKQDFDRENFNGCYPDAPAQGSREGFSHG